MKKKENEKKMARLDDRYVRRLQRLPPIKPHTVSESLFEAFPRLRELLRDGEATIKSLIKMGEDMLRQYHKVLVYADVRVDDDDGH